MGLRALHDLPAPAKLNLFLHVVGRRTDGYHLLQSVFVLIDWADTLHLDLRTDGGLSREDLGTALPADDLCLRAARALQQAAGTRLGAHIAIDKQVPWGAGLGGGSSDAATTLIGLNRLWGLRWSRSQLLRLAVGLGADVPFFIEGRSAWVEGIGDRLQPIDLPRLRFAVLKPPQPVPTAAIFGDPALVRDSRPATIADFLAAPRTFGRNDLQASACRYSHQVTEALQVLDRLVGVERDLGPPSGWPPSGLRADRLGQALDRRSDVVQNAAPCAAVGSSQATPSRMTGSGSAVFALLPDDPGAVKDVLAFDPAGAAAQAGAVREAVSLPADLAEAGWRLRCCDSLAVHPLRPWVE